MNCWAAGLASLVISVWAGYESVPNPDALVYLRAASLFEAGQWAKAMAMYHWPAYSLSIASVMAVTGLGAHAAALTVNALLTIGTTIAFISIVSTLSERNRLAISVAAVLVVFHPQLTDVRDWIIRDHGYWCFFLIAVDLTLRDLQQPGLGKKALAVAAMVAATLFRVEGAYLFLLLPAFWLFVRAENPTHRAVIMVAFAGLTTLSVLGYAVWAAGGRGTLLSGGVAEITQIFSANVSERTDALEQKVVNPGGVDGKLLYVAIAIAVLLAGVLRAVTPVQAAVLLGAYFPARILPRFASQAVSWLALGQIPLLLTYTLLHLMLPWRYAVGVALIALIPAVFVVAEMIREWRARVPRSFVLLPVASIALGINWILEIPRPSELHHLKQAGEWVRNSVPANVYVWTNESRIAFYSGRAFQHIPSETGLRHSPEQFLPMRDEAVFLVDLHHSEPVPDYIFAIEPIEHVRDYVGENGRVVHVYRR